MSVAIRSNRLSVVLDATFAMKLDELAAAHGLDRSSMIRFWIAREHQAKVAARRTLGRPKAGPKTYYHAPALIHHATGPIYYSWAGLSRNGYIKPESSRYASMSPTSRIGQEAVDSWAEENPVGTPDVFSDGLWHDGKPPIPDPDSP